MISQDRKTRLIYLCAFALLLSSIEYLIPKPLPFLKIGLANLPILLASSFLPLKELLILSVSKSIVQSIISGTTISPFFIISLISTLVATFFMYFSFRIFKKSTFIGISVIGALTNNICQISLAAILIYGKSIFIALPLVALMGIITSIILGVFANILNDQSEFIQKAKDLTLDSINNVTSLDNANKTKNITITVFAFTFILLSVFVENIIYLLVILTLSYILQKASKRKIKLTYPLILLFSMVLISVFDQQGQVLFHISKLYITKDSLIFYTTKAIRILIIIASSQSLIKSSYIKFGWVEKVFYLYSCFLNNFSSKKGSFIKRIDQALLNN
jgi:heptaprenyl diphosphate synthase